MKDLTIVMPTYDRYDEVYRHLKQLNKHFKGVSIIIVDGTKKEDRLILNTSLHPDISIDQLCFETNIVDRIKIGVSRVDTRFACLMADDDRLFEKGVDMSIDFLKKRDRFIASYGKTYCWHTEKGCKQMYNYSDGPRSFDKISRVLRAMHVYTPQLYCSIWRTSALNDVVQVAGASNWSSGQVFEFLVVLAGNLYGNHCCLDMPYWERSTISHTVTEGIDRDTSIGSWMEENVDELVIAKNAFKDFFKQDTDLIDLAFLQYKFFEQNRHLLVSSGFSEPKYKPIVDQIYPGSRIFKIVEKPDGQKIALRGA